MRAVASGAEDNASDSADSPKSVCTKESLYLQPCTEFGVRAVPHGAENMPPNAANSHQIVSKNTAKSCDMDASLDLSPSLSARYKVKTPVKLHAATHNSEANKGSVEGDSKEIVAKETERDALPAALSSGISSSRGGGVGGGKTRGGDSMFPLMMFVTAEQFDSVPDYLRSQIR